MRSSQPVSLFSGQPQSTGRPTSFLVSTLVHGALLGLLYLGIVQNPGINDRMLSERYVFRHLDLHTPESMKQPSEESSAMYPSPQPTAQGNDPGEQPVVPASFPGEIAQRTPAPQTLVQPDLPPNLQLPRETPIPAVLLWSAQKTPTKKIVPPQPHEATAAEVRPSLDPPNEEANLADLGVSAADIAAAPQALSPSTTSPVAVRGPEKEHVPETTSKGDEQPTPAAAMSLSDLHMREGTVTLPPANETGPAAAAKPLTNGQAGGLSQKGTSGPAGRKDAIGAGRNSGDSKKSADPTEGPAKPKGSNAAPTQEATGGSAQEAGAGPGQDREHSAEHINLPKNGQFGAVVVGSSMEEQYPESAGVWRGRLAYTVYLHVGLAKSWILQYSVPRSADSASGGNVARLEAPWPYNIVRPNLASGDVDADALMVHGFVNEAGRFEALAMVFPPEFSQAQFVLNMLQQWQFRPAMQNGQSAKVEVLLIIPEEPE
jgi:hypothetical protein